MISTMSCGCVHGPISSIIPINDFRLPVVPVEHPARKGYENNMQSIFSTDRPFVQIMIKKDVPGHGEPVFFNQ